MRGVARDNVGAETLLALLDSHREYVEDVEDRRRRLFINGVYVDANTRRELRRYRHGQVGSLRIETAEKLLTKFNLTLEHLYGRS